MNTGQHYMENYSVFFTNKSFRVFFVLLILLFSNSSSANNDLTCTYTLLSNWGLGSQLTFKIKNNTNRDIPVWNLKISYPQSYSLTTSWSVNVTGTNPIIFSNAPGNVLKPGEWYTHNFGYQVNHGGAAFQNPQIDWCGEPPTQQTGTTQNIPLSGGIINNAEIGSVIFDANAFTATTEVRLYKSASQDINDIFINTTELFSIDNRADEVRINTGSQPPSSEFVEVELVVPNDIVNRINSGHSVGIFAGLEQGGSGELSFLVFDQLNSNYDSDTHKIHVSVPGAAFFKNELTKNNYETVLVIATAAPPSIQNYTQFDNFAVSIKATNSALLMPPSALSAPTNQCNATEISCPVSGGCIVSSPFAPARVHPTKGGVKAHTGVDLKATLGTQINAAASGIVEQSYRHGSYGEMVIIRHDDGSATLYAHMSSRSVSKGQTISQGQQLGAAGATGVASGVHLHFEYITAGTVMESKRRIDPMTCIKTPTSATLTFEDVDWGGDSANDDIYEISFRSRQDPGIVYAAATTGLGESITFDLSHLLPEVYVLYVKPIVAPDYIGTAKVTLTGKAELIYTHAKETKFLISLNTQGYITIEIKP